MFIYSHAEQEKDLQINLESFLCSLSDGLEQNAEDLKSERDKKRVDWGDVEENIRAKRITRSERQSFYTQFSVISL